MPLINWNDTLSVNVNEIDQQHKNLIRMINELNDAMKQGKGRTVIGKIIKDMIDYTTTHFKTEEGYFDRFGYPEAAGHKREHALFVEKVSAFSKGFEEEKLSLSIEVLDFLSDWLKNHIKGTDRKYSEFFNRKGLS
jgi:hemerythrin